MSLTLLKRKKKDKKKDKKKKKGKGNDTATDFFEHIGSDIKLKNKKRTITNPTNKYHTCYGSDKYIADCTSPNGTFKWSIKINKVGAEICIGVESANTMNNLDSAFHLGEDTHYAYSNKGDIFYNTNIAQEMPASFKDNDLIIIVLDTKERIIEFFRNDTIVQKCSDINAEIYRLAVFLRGRKTRSSSVTIENCIIENAPQRQSQLLPDAVEMKEDEILNGNGIGDASKDEMVGKLLDTIERQKQEINQLKQVFL